MRRLLLIAVLPAAALVLGVLATDVLGVSQPKPVAPIELKQEPRSKPAAKPTRKPAAEPSRPSVRKPASRVRGAAPAPAPPPACAGDHDAHPDDCAGDAERDVEGD